MRGAADIASLLAAGLVPNLAYLGVGLWSLRALRVPAGGAERFALAFALGTGFSSLAILLLRTFDLPLPLAGLAAVAAAAVPAVGRGGPGDALRRAGARGLPWIDAATAAAACLLFLAALAPETFWDGFEYHLPIAQAFARGPIRALPGVLDAEFRAGVELLYVPAVSASEPDAAAAVTACFAIAIALAIRSEAARRASRRAGAVAGLFALLVPLTLDYAASTYVDHAVGLYGYFALLFADRWNRTGESRALVVSALCLGFAANAKLHAVALWPAVLLLVTAAGRPPGLGPLLGGGLLATAVATPWVVKAALTTGNPFFPFFGEWLGYGPTTRAHLDLRRERLITDFHGHRNWSRFLAYLASVHFSRHYAVGGLIGPLPLGLAPLALHRLSRPTAVLGLVLALLLVLQFWYMPALRFGTPLLPFAAIAAAVGGLRLARSGAAARAALAATLVALALHHGADAVSRFGPRVAALRDPQAYERARFPDQVALREIVARAEPVVGISMGAVSWMPGPVYNLHWVRNGELFFSEPDRMASPVSALALLRRRGVRSLVIQARAPLPGDGRVGHPIVDAWLRRGVATLRTDVPRRPATHRGHVWVLVDLAPD